MKIRSGDIFCVDRLSPRGPADAALGWLIKGVSKARSTDNDAWARHAGIICDEEGTTFEALFRYGSQNLYDAYRGHRVLIGRHRDMTPLKAYAAIEEVRRRYEGRLYPFFRLIAHATQTTAKLFPMFKPVCSELDGEMCHYATLSGFEYYKGLTPDNLADRIIWWREFEIIYDGTL